MTTRRIAVPLGLLALSLLLAACGSSGSSKGADNTSQPLATSADFPAPKGKSLLEIKRSLGPGPVLAPTVSVVAPGRDRYGFGLFDRARKQISEAPVALYVERSGSRKVAGPFLAHDLPLAVKPAFQSETVAKDPQAAKSLYVADLRVKNAGNYAVLGVAKLDGRLVATDPIYLGVGTPSQVPSVGQKAPVITTPTVQSVGGDVSKIDTRVPPSDMHAVDFADVVGKKPVALLFSTPQLCQSRVCGPVTDMELQMKSKYGDKMDFIHQEVYVDNDVNKGLRPPLQQFNVRSEPWLFVVNAKGIITARLEGSIGVTQFENAVKTGL
jgi:hypothetical protein